MRISVEISYYPLQEEYIPAILSFVDRLKEYPKLQIDGNGMSTHVFGDYSEVMEVLTREIKKSFDIPHSVFILKIINSDLHIYPPSHE